MAVLNRNQRGKRKHTHPPSEDLRSPGQRDRDRILYSSALRRLASVTQVVGSSEGHIFHNRLTHSLEVAQIARRLAEYQNTRLSPRGVGTIDPDVVEAAALAHDLGHPPFGHVAEAELNRLVQDEGNTDGFEGNAQSFRIVTRLAAHREGYLGLDLSVATLNGLLKYPWTRDAAPKGAKPGKFGVYVDDIDVFNFARTGLEEDQRPTSEAQLMDYADGVAYSVHDLHDFYRAGLIPIDRLAAYEEEFFGVLEKWVHSGRIQQEELDQHVASLQRLVQWLATQTEYTGTREQRAHLAGRSALMIGRYVDGVRLQSPDRNGKVVVADPAHPIELGFLQRLVWHYVIDNPRLATQQEGQRKIVEYLFLNCLSAIRNGNRWVIPASFREEMEDISRGPLRRRARARREARLAADVVASLTDDAAQSLYLRLSGVRPGSLLELLDG